MYDPAEGKGGRVNVVRESSPFPARCHTAALEKAPNATIAGKNPVFSFSLKDLNSFTRRSLEPCATANVSIAHRSTTFTKPQTFLQKRNKIPTACECSFATEVTFIFEKVTFLSALWMWRLQRCIKTVLNKTFKRFSSIKTSESIIY